ncbi:hypothetical protein ACSV4D_08920 [Flavobacterium sp. ARAG 55.4]
MQGNIHTIQEYMVLNILMVRLPFLRKQCLPDAAKAILTDMGKWNKINGQTIFETRPWRIYGEDPTKIS